VSDRVGETASVVEVNHFVRTMSVGIGTEHAEGNNLGGRVHLAELAQEGN